ncbi:hypothetical protein EJ03DRAFT_332198 [Teratosphaeria nubilosa]|uniref:Uncharacterized protein n=1 Tax=Teratosphaeria nubilosa TaxID=161662 RepID=A0A6G1KUG9_9PEZI|nr:hypothetical protein EJ03DRAFT_332198 [Teratosphaeria nubilosa]
MALGAIIVVIITIFSTPSPHSLSSSHHSKNTQLTHLHHSVPPLGAFFVAGCGADLLINILLTILGYFPGHIHGKRTSPPPLLRDMANMCPSFLPRIPILPPP